MRMTIVAGALALALTGCAYTQPAIDYSKAKLDSADAWMQEFLADRQPFETATEWLSRKTREGCAALGGEWVAEGEGEAAPGECVVE